MILALLLAVVGCRLVTSSVIPQSPHDVSQYHVGSVIDGTYQWGYYYPGQFHVENKDADGAVSGSVGYMDAYGKPISWAYVSDPVNGYRIVTDEKMEVPSFKSGPVNPVPADNPLSISPYQQIPSNSVLFRFLESSPNPVPIFKSSLDGGYPEHFLVLPEVIQNAGGVSQTAVALGVAPIAAVHDGPHVARYN